jgi:uncharacterized protein (DUF1800 family)
MSLEAAAIAANRFGLGARPGDLETIAGDPRGWLKAQLRAESSPPPALAQLPTASEAVVTFTSWLADLRTARMEATAGATVQKSFVGAFGPGLAAGAKARIETVTGSDRPFFDRLCGFWRNHFTVSAAKPAVVTLAPIFERDVVRPNACGRFEDMLLASCRHPGMLMYLDNYLSVGPDSLVGRRPQVLPAQLQGRMRGLNENLAREILELHTLGVRTGYTQDDVVSLAKCITGWTIHGPKDPQEAGVFRFLKVAHEPGAQTLLGKTYAEDGEAQGEAALRDLAAHPATAQHLATKLVRHFVADDPPPAAVARVAAAYRSSGGDLAVSAAALVDSPEAWSRAPAKFKPPEDYVISTLRALGGPELAGPQLVALLDRMGQRPFSPPGPDGWPDVEERWTGTDAVWKRLEWADAVGRRLGAASHDPAGRAREALGPQLSEATLQAIQAADSPAQGLALFLVSPEFQRR